MDELILETPDTLPQAAEFAALQFGKDMTVLQPRLFVPPVLGSTYSLRRDGRRAGLISLYEVRWGERRCLSVGTVCTDKAFRGQGIMTAMFEQLEPVFQQYDLLTLGGRRVRYEHFGFAKGAWVPEYRFYPSGKPAGLQLLPLEELSGDRLLALWQEYGTGVERAAEHMHTVLGCGGHKGYALTDGGVWGYLCWDPKNRRVVEYCGPWPAQQVTDLLAAQLALPRVGFVGKYCAHDREMLSQCDRYMIENRGTVRLRNKGLEETYRLLGHGGSDPELKLPSCLFFQDRI